MTDHTFAALDPLLEGCQVIDREYRYVYLNDAVVDHARLDRDGLLGRAMPEVYPGIEDTEMFRALARCMREREPASMENQFSYPDGGQACFELRFEPIPEGVLILSIDISSRKRSERALATLRRCSQALSRATDEIGFMIEVANLLTSSGAYRLAWIGRLDPNRRLHPVVFSGVDERTWQTLSDTDWLAAPGLQAIRQREPVTAQRADSSLGPLSSIALPLAEAGEPTGALTIYSDDPLAFDDAERALLCEVASDLGDGIELLRARQARADMEKRLSEAQRLEAIGRLAGGVAHDFNNLLSVILSYATLAIEELESGQLRDDIGEIYKAGVRASALTRQLLAFSRKETIERRVTDVNEIISGLEKMLGRLLGEHVHMEVRSGQQLGNIVADPAQLEQIVVNLAINARDAMPGGGRLTIETRNVDLDESYTRDHVLVSPGSYIQLSISDTGEGMSPETRARAFEPFYTTKGSDGTGLGLATVYGIVKQSDGHLHLYSEPGIGTIFKMFFPRVDAPSTRIEPPSPALFGDETILLVEDEPQVRRAASRILEAAGYQVISASDGNQALELCHSHEGRIDLVVTDVIMPNMSGRELADNLETLKPEAKILFTSGFTDEAIADQGVLGSGANFISKPFSIMELTHSVRATLDS